MTQQIPAEADKLLRQEADSLLELVARPEWETLIKGIKEEREAYEYNIVNNAEDMNTINRYRGIIVAYNKFINMKDTLLNFTDMYDEEYHGSN